MDHATFHTLNQAFDAAFNRQDSATIATLYAPQAVVLPAPGGQPVQGPAAIAEFFAGLMSAGVVEHRLDMDALVTGTELATQYGRWSAQLPDVQGQSQTLGGNVQQVFQRQADGRWLVLTHIWN